MATNLQYGFVATMNIRIARRSLGSLAQALLWLVCSCSSWAQTPVATAELECVQLERTLPAPGIEIPAAQRDTWMTQLQALEGRLAAQSSALRTDVEVLIKACRLAIEVNELYSEKDFAKVDRLLALAHERLDALAAGTADWQLGHGRQVRGFRSGVDGSVQPVGLLLPAGWGPKDPPRPLYVWLHGRGDKTTDLHFICERLDKDGQITPEGAIVVHPFGRHCVGYKSAGETDVMEAIDFVCANYPVDQRRIVLMGFSMGGAGVWHLAAHYGERFVAASPGAGFAETARYQGLQPERYPVRYEQILWSVYDVPGYTRNLFNFPIVAYSGELDKQIQAARVMEEAFAAQGRTLPHLIGPGMGHKYHPDTLAEIMARMAAAAEQGQPAEPHEIFIQSPHPRYAKRQWLTIDGQIQQYADTRADATWADGQWSIATRNVSRLIIDSRVSQAAPTKPVPSATVRIDGGQVRLQPDRQNYLLKDSSGGWSTVDQFVPHRKRPGLSGPIDDAFIDPFLVVLPSGRARHPQIEQWVRCESRNFLERWQSLFRGQARTKLDRDVTAEDLARYHVVLWGDPQNNSVMRKVLEAEQEGGVVRWNQQQVACGPHSFAAASHVLLAIRPNPLAPGRYVVFNSGPTFRQAHDRTNSLQNPHLPDWAVVSVETPPSEQSPGKIKSAGFFDDAWRVDAKLTW